MKKKIITCASVSFVIILVLLSVNFLQSGTGSISKENIDVYKRQRKSFPSTVRLLQTLSSFSHSDGVSCGESLTVRIMT